MCGAQTCGAQNESGNVGRAPRPLMRSIYERKIAGVCAGVARYLDVDVTVVRLIWLTLAFVPLPVGLIAYLIAWIVVPKEPARVNAAGSTAYQN